MSSEKVTVKCECSDCGATGIFKGWNCHDGAASVCRRCKGTGAVELSYTPFTERKKVTDVKRVFVNVSHMHVFPSKYTFDSGNTIDFSQYGCTLEEWEAGVEPKPIPD